MNTFAFLDGTFLGVSVDEGDHDLIFVYKSKWVLAGRIVGILGIILYLLSIAIFYTQEAHRKTKA